MTKLPFVGVASWWVIPRVISNFGEKKNISNLLQGDPSLGCELAGRVLTGSTLERPLPAPGRQAGTPHLSTLMHEGRFWRLAQNNRMFLDVSGT